MYMYVIAEHRYFLTDYLYTCCGSVKSEIIAAAKDARDDLTDVVLNLLTSHKINVMGNATGLRRGGI